MANPEQPHLIRAERAANMPPIQIQFAPTKFLGTSTAQRQLEELAYLRDWIGAVLKRENASLARGRNFTAYQRLYAALAQMRYHMSFAGDVASGKAGVNQLSFTQTVPFSNPQEEQHLRLQPLPPEDMIVELKAMQDLAVNFSSPSRAPCLGDGRLLNAWCHMVLEQVVMPINAAIAREEAFLRNTEQSLVRASEPEVPVIGQHARTELARIAALATSQPGRGKS